MKHLTLQGTLIASLLTVACGPQLGSVAGGSKDSETTTVDNRRETVTIGVGVEQSSKLSLAAATSFSMSLDGCASGLAYANITQSNPNVDVYKFDQNCLIKLNSFSLNGITFVPSGADPFSSWLLGDIAIFEEAGNPTNVVRVVVSSQLGSPIAGTETVAYSFSQIAAGSDSSLAKSTVGNSHSLSVSGQDATPLTIAGLSFTGMTATGAGQFVFTLECGQNVTGTAPALSCAGTSLDSLKYRLVKDTFGGTLTVAQASAIFDGTEVAIADAEKLGVGAASAPKGGFTTKSGASALQGPDQMHANPNMLFVVQVAGSSYRYFNVDVTTLAYP